MTGKCDRCGKPLLTDNRIKVTITLIDNWGKIIEKNKKIFCAKCGTDTLRIVSQPAPKKNE